MLLIWSVLAVLCCVSVGVGNELLFSPGLKRVCLEEEVCQASWHTRVKIYLENDNTTCRAYFQDSLTSWNGDLTLHESGTRVRVVSTDIQSALKLRKTIAIKDRHGCDLVIAEQVLFDKLFSPSAMFRGYTLYNDQGRELGAMEKREFGGTEMTVHGTDGKHYARASKTPLSKLGSLFCANPRWELEIYEGHNASNPLTDARVLSTLIAIKASADIHAASQQRSALVITLLDVLFSGDK